MREIPIPFSGPMVRANIEGRKTMTRRVVRLRDGEDLHEWDDGTFHAVQDHGCHVTERKINCPYGQPGDTLWDVINAERGDGWAVNPFVWVVGYEVVEVRK